MTERDGPRRGVRFQIFDGEIDFELPVPDAPEPFGDLTDEEKWRARQDSNLWPTAPEAVALSS